MSIEEFFKLPLAEIPVAITMAKVKGEETEEIGLAIALRILAALEDNAKATRELRDEVKNLSSSDNDRGLTFMVGELTRRFDSYIEKEFHAVK